VRRGGAFETGAGPPIVHCSAGIGRSGTFVVVDALLLLIEAQPKRRWDAADVHNLLLGLRLCRMGLVQTFDQYRFCFQAVVDEGKQFMEIYQRKAILPTELITSGASQIDQSKYANIASSSTSNPKAVMSRNSLEQNTRSKTQGSRPEIQPAPSAIHDQADEEWFVIIVSPRPTQTPILYTVRAVNPQLTCLPVGRCPPASDALPRATPSRERRPPASDALPRATLNF
jgi:hypothetical protein